MEQKPPTVVSSSVPAFLIKLWKLVEDSSVDHLLSWSKNGTTFCVHDPVILARDVLPLYFKHNNFTSFVRQLNMYGFKKVISSEHGGIKPEKDEWEFHHPNFTKGKADLLEYVKRKVHPEDKKIKNEDFSVIVEDVKELRAKNSVVQNRLESMKIENEDLWREVADLRIKHKRQQHVLNKLIEFLILIYGPKGSAPENVSSRKRLAIELGQAHSKKMRPGQLSEVDDSEHPYSVESPGRPEQIYPVDMEESNRGPQIVILPDEPKITPVDVKRSIVTPADVNRSIVTPADVNRSSVTPVDVKRSIITPDDDKLAKTRRVQPKKSSTKSKDDSLKLQIPTMVSLPAQREPIMELTPSFFDGLSQLFPMDSLGNSGDMMQELQRTLPVGHSTSALVPARSNSTVDKDEIGMDVEQINGSLNTLQRMLSGPHFDIDSNTLQQLFDVDDAKNDSSLRSIHDGGIKLETATESQAMDDQTVISGDTECETLEPFSPGMFLNDDVDSHVDTVDNTQPDTE